MENFSGHDRRGSALRLELLFVEYIRQYWTSVQIGFQNLPKGRNQMLVMSLDVTTTLVKELVQSVFTGSFVPGANAGLGSLAAAIGLS